MSAPGKRVWYAPWRRRPAERRALGDSAFGELFSRAVSEAGLSVTPDSALRVATVFACVRVLSESVASLPCLLYVREGRERRRAIEHPLFQVLRHLANPELTAFEFFDDAMLDLALRGNAYARVRRDGAGDVRSLWPMRVRDTKVERVGGKLRYQWVDPDGRAHVFLRDEVLHVRGPSKDGVLGLCTTDESREAIALAQIAEAFGSRFFANDASAGVILEYAGKLSDSARERLKKSFDDSRKGRKHHSTVVFEEGLKANKIQTTPEDSQFLETRKLQVAEICRVFRVPPHLVMDLERATFSNIEHQGIEFVEHSLRPWLVRWEQAIYRDLLSSAEQQIYFAEFLVDALLRGDFSARTAGYATARQNGWMSANEIRERENLYPLIPADQGGDDYLQPLNMGQPGEDGQPRRPARTAPGARPPPPALDGGDGPLQPADDPSPPGPGGDGPGGGPPGKRGLNGGGERAAA
jgi:HK97 family phage portal protein